MPDLSTNLSPIAWVIWMGALGACIGSFINVLSIQWPIRLRQQWNRDVADYLERSPESLALDVGIPGENWLTRRSRCPRCGAALGWWQLIPIFSFLMLRGRCHHCNTPISMRYPVVEIATALLFICVAIQHPPGLQATIGVLLLSWLMALTLIDLDTMLLPDDLTLSMLWLGLLHASVFQPETLSDRVMGAIAGYASLWLVYQAFRLTTGREGMGYGDFKLLAAMGAWLGWAALLPIVLVASLAGSLWGVALILLRRQDRQEPMPFGPWLALGGALEIVHANPVSRWLLALV